MLEKNVNVGSFLVLRRKTGFAQGDYSDTTGWIFTVNGELPDVGAGEITIEEGDKIVWSFIDFSTYQW